MGVVVDMVIFYFCVSCDLSFSVAHTGYEPKVKCPYCHAGKVKRVHRRYNNSVKGFSFRELV